MTRELEAVEEGERRFHSVDPGFTWTDIHTSQLPFLHSWVVWVAGPLLGARFFGFQIVATEFKGIQFFVKSFSLQKKAISSSLEIQPEQLYDRSPVQAAATPLWLAQGGGGRGGHWEDCRKASLISFICCFFLVSPFSDCKS